MARKKSASAITSENEVVAEKTEVELPEEPKMEEKTEVTLEFKKTDSKVWIKNPKSAYKKIRVMKDVYLFDSEGKALVSSADAEVFLSLPGFETAE